MRFTIFQESRKGSRKVNQDRIAYTYSRDTLLLVVADGMGGHAGGDVASSTVIAGLVSLDDEALSGRDLSEALLARILSANADIGNEVRSEPRLDGMGTTLIAMLRSGDKIVLAHIGDSRAFMVRDGVVTQVTKDHSFVQTLVDEGRITAEEAQTHPQRSLVTRVLTGSVDDEPDQDDVGVGSRRCG